MKLEQNLNQEKNKIPIWQFVLLSAILFFIFILPFKFGIPAGFPDINIFPENSAMWFFSFWPPLLFSIISAFLSACCIFTFPININYLNHAIIIPLLFAILAFSSLTGFLKATCLDFPIQECIYLFGLSAFSIIIFMIISQEKVSTCLILKAITISTLIVACYGIYQYVSGFENTRKYVIEVLSNKNILLPEEAKTRLNDNFVFSTFTISNNFAAHLLLTGPICFYMLFYSNLLQTKISRYTLTSAAILTIIAALLLSGSRGAILSLALASIILLVLLSIKSKKSVILVLTILLTIIAIIVLIPKDSGSIFIRFDYLQAGLILLKNNLITGAGWGEFFHSYTYLKKFMTTEAPHDPHNFIISMGSQAGIAAIIAATLIMIVPILLTLKKINKFSLKGKFKTPEFSMLLGVMAWSIHSFMDINFQIPGTTAVVIVFYIIMTKTENPFHYPKFYTKTFKTISLFISLIIIIPGFYKLRGEYYISRLSNICYPQFSYKESVKTNIAKAEKLLKTTIEAVPYSPFPWAVFGDYAMKNNMIGQAEICFNNAIRLSPKRANFYYNLAIIQLGKNEKGYAIKNMEIASRLFPYKYNIPYNKMRESYYKRL